MMDVVRLSFWSKKPSAPDVERDLTSVELRNWPTTANFDRNRPEIGRILPDLAEIGRNWSNLVEVGLDLAELVLHLDKISPNLASNNESRTRP